MTNEQKFMNALESIFVGAEIEGESGYVNLMKIKSKYFEEIKDKLLKLIDEQTRLFPEFREELFDKLYNFFSRYFSRTGSVYFTYTPFNERIYERVYKNDQDVALFWKTHMLYYVKSDVIYQSMKAEVDGINFFFDVTKLEHKQNNETRREIIFEFNDVKKIDNKKTIVLDVMYSTHGRKTKNDDILRKARKKDIDCPEETLNKAIRVFKQQSEVDYFINKNAKAFLEEQFDLWMYHYIFKEENVFTEKRIKQLQVLKKVAYAIIAFIAQFEDELVKVWNKPKFVLNSNYVITKDKILEQNNGDKVLKKLLKSNGINEQINEWKKLDIVDNSFKKEDILNEKYKHLPFDTKYFKKVELDLLGLFDSLDECLDGWLIHSENYQALNTILPKFEEKIQTIYIDPPFNLESSDQFLYRTNYKDASWATLIENRLRIAKEWLNKNGKIFIRCDYHGNWIIRCLMEDIFGNENFRNELIINKSNKQGAINKRFNPATETLFLYSKVASSLINPQFRKRNKQRGWLEMHSPKENKNSHTVTFDGKQFVAPKGRHWSFAQETINKLASENRIRVINKRYIDVYGNEQNEMLEYLMSENETIESDWTDIPGYSTTTSFQTENSEKLLSRVINTGSDEKDFVLDYFLGSGTTTAVAHKLHRKWIGIEMGEHFYTITLPRMKKVLAYDKSGISKNEDVKEIYSKDNAGGFFKYYDLEQYEETLRNIAYKDGQIHMHDLNRSPFEQYIFLRDEKMAKCVDVKENEVKVDLKKLYPNIDVAETLSNLTGKWIKKITKDYVEFEDGTKESLKNPDYKLIKPLIWW